MATICKVYEFLDRNHTEPHPGPQHALRQLGHSQGLVDAWSRLVEDGVSMKTLDRFYCFKQHFNAFKSCSIIPAGFTDHALVLCCVFIRNVVPKSAYWHFNSVLKRF